MIQNLLKGELSRIFSIFKHSNAEIRPHFILTGPSGCGKSYTIKELATIQKLGYFEINAAQLTKEGTSGNSLSKALSPLLQMAKLPTVVFVDEFDKLFISGNSNISSAHESTVGVQNEFLKILETDVTSVYGDFGKYINASVGNVLFVFAGAFNGEEDITLDKLRDFGLKTEFLGRVGLVFNCQKLTVDDMLTLVDSNQLLDKYCSLVEGSDREKISYLIKGHIQKNHEMNTLGARLINTLVHQYFITGGLETKEVKKVSFQTKLKLKL